MNTPPLRFKFWLIGCLVWVLALVGTRQVLAQDIPPKPNPPRLVNDYVGMLNDGEKETLEQKLRAYNDSTSSQVTIVVVKTTGDYPPGDYAFELGKRWGVGQKDKDNGLVLLWATDDRKIFIATGRGLEGAIPDAIAKRIITNIITPHFKKQEWYLGLDEATTEIFRRAGGEYQNDNSGSSSSDGGGGVFVVIMLVIILVVLIIVISNRRGGGRNNGGYRPGGTWMPPIIITGSGSSSGGWGGGGGSDFGGFGGGDFGGGGAGGDY